MPQKKPQGQWRGLDTLFLENSVDETVKNQKTTLRTGLIEPKSGQPRKTFEQQPLEQLAASISTHGILQPILVRELPNGKYQIVAGERRWRAAKLAGLVEVPVIVLESDEREAAEIALVENIQREDLNPVEEAMAYRALAEEYGLTQEQLSQKIGKSRSAIANFERLLDLSDEVLSLVASKELSAGHARTLLSLREDEDRLLLARRTIAEGWSVRTLEEEVKRLLRRKKAAAAAAEGKDEPEAFAVDYAKVLENRLMRELGRRVTIAEGKRKKTVTFYYEDNEDLDRFLRRVCGDAFMDEE
ncbi:MAG: ParB/RepB/Spo0J family partition protein [Clostridia bacterium]|nr:ParB/RepB/Spo0J family partition protein [Clostridia bacterium]